MAQIKAVTFDIGGTLIQPWESVGHVYAEVAARHGIKHASPEMLNDRFRAAWNARRGFNDSRADWESLVDEVFEGLAVPPPRATFFPELYERFAQPDAWRIFEDVMPTLKELAAKQIRLGAISNWDERLRVLLRRLGLHDSFELIVVSCEVGFSKPSPVIFQRAAAGLGLPPSAILHVGDSRELDVEGARSAGLRAVQVVRSATALGDGQVASLEEIVGLV